MARVIIFGVLGGLWTFLCLALLIVVVAGSGISGVVALLLTSFDAQRVANLVAEYGALGVFLVWLAGVIVLALIAWAMRATRGRVVVITGGGTGLGERPMKDVTPPRSDGRDARPEDRHDERGGALPPR
jgi:hypothetical protein